MEGTSKKQKSRASSADPHSVKKRHRVAIVCINCRRKKIKCDKKKPECDNCVKANAKCQYQDLVWASSTVVDDDGRVSSYNDYSGQKIFVMSDKGLVPFKGKDPNDIDDAISYPQTKTASATAPHRDYSLPIGHPPIDANDRMDFYEGTMSTDDIVRSGPFSWLIFASKDKFIKLLWLKASQTKQRQLLYLDTSFKENLAGDDDHHGAIKHLKPKLAVPSYQPIPPNHIKDVILKSLPTKKTLWILVPRFLNFLYPFFSYFDPKKFVSTIEEALVTHRNDFADEMFTEVKIERKCVLCHIAMLFVVLRFGFLSLSEDVLDTSEERLYVLNHPITIESVSASQILLNQFNLFEKPPLELLQAYIYMRAYHHYSPEQGDNTGVADSSMFNGIIISLSISLGLNRDPSHMEQYKDDIDVCNLRRRLWHFVAMFDVYQTVSLGRPSAFNISHHKVKLPQVNGPDLCSKENLLCLGFEEYMSGYELVSEVASVAAHPYHTNVYKLAQGVKKIDDLKNKPFKSMSAILNQKNTAGETPETRLRRIVQLIRYVFLNTFCFTVEYNIFLHYENSSRANKELARYYFSKILARSDETMKNMPPLMTRSPDYFGYGIDVIQFPATLLSLHKALQVQTSLSLRCQHAINLINLKRGAGVDAAVHIEDKKIISYLKAIIKSISKRLEDYLHNLDNAYNKYQYAWRLKRPHTLFWLITNQECFTVENGKVVAQDSSSAVYENADIPQTNILVGMSMSELSSLYPISDEEMAKLKSRKKTSLKHAVHTDVEAASPSVKDERSPSLSNLLNHEDEEHSNSSSSFTKSPAPSSVKAVVDPSIDQNWINLLYTDQADNVSFSTHPQRVEVQQPSTLVLPPAQPQLRPPSHLQQSIPAMGLSNHQNQMLQMQEQGQQNQRLPQQEQQQEHHYVDNQEYVQRQQLASNLVSVQSKFADPRYLPAKRVFPQHSHQFSSKFESPARQWIQQQQIPQQSFAYPSAQSMMAPERPIMSTENNNHQASQGGVHASSGINNFDEFFTLIGANGFSTIDEMFGSVEFYDNTL